MTGQFIKNFFTFARLFVYFWMLLVSISIPFQLYHIFILNNEYYSLKTIAGALFMMFLGYLVLKFLEYIRDIVSSIESS
jgi:hypothetical protein